MRRFSVLHYFWIYCRLPKRVTVLGTPFRLTWPFYRRLNVDRNGSVYPFAYYNDQVFPGREKPGFYVSLCMLVGDRRVPPGAFENAMLSLHSGLHEERGEVCSCSAL